MKKRSIDIYTIKNADKNDIPRLAEIEAECIADPWNENAFISEMEKDNAIIIKAVDENGIICGFVSADILLDEVNIYNVAVSKEFRRCGIAKMLLLYLEEITKDCANVYMLEVRESNIPAISLYHLLGFCDVGMRKNYYQLPCENALLMTKTIERNTVNEDTCN